MHEASRDNRTSPPPRAARQTCVWFRSDLCGLTHQQWWEERMCVDCSLMGTKSNKAHGQCMHISRHPNCTTRIRQHQFLDGEIVSEQTGQHNHDCSKEACKHGLPQHCKEAIDELPLLNNKFKPSQIVNYLEKKIKRT